MYIYLPEATVDGASAFLNAAVEPHASEEGVPAAATLIRGTERSGGDEGGRRGAIGLAVLQPDLPH